MYRKFFVALAAALSAAVAQGLLPESVGQWVAIGAGFLGALGVYAVPNQPLVRPNGHGERGASDALVAIVALAAGVFIAWLFWRAR